MGCDLHLNQKSTPLVVICFMTQCHAYWHTFVSWLFCMKGASISWYFGLVSTIDTIRGTGLETSTIS